ncbi:biotin/lipoyl-containing protein [Clostridium aceticum]|nr:biotin/lipoyl-containing protein [Clostridium aceticum]KJF25585.1 biotin attachment protein [Clostridium aceticum]
MRKFHIIVNGVSYEVEVEEIKDNVATPKIQTPPIAVKSAPARPSAKSMAVQAAKVESPMPGIVLKVFVKEGQEVKEGEVLLILEAMKLENEIYAPVDGIVTGVHVTEGASVANNELLISLE